MVLVRLPTRTLPTKIFPHISTRWPKDFVNPADKPEVSRILGHTTAPLAGEGADLNLQIGIMALNLSGNQKKGEENGNRKKTIIHR
jgi:hypothetical protein